MFLIIFSKINNLCSRLLFYQNLLINTLFTSAFILVNGIIFNRSDLSITKCSFNSMFDELNEVKYFKEIQSNLS